jgi:hypothetical protein
MFTTRPVTATHPSLHRGNAKHIHKKIHKNIGSKLNVISDNKLDMNWNFIGCIVTIMITADNKMATNYAYKISVFDDGLYLGSNWSLGSTFVSESLSELANFSHQVSLPLVKRVAVPFQ